jgi:predicted permease
VTVDTLLQDTRIALRGLARNPGFALGVILTITLALGINTAVFSVVHAVLIAPLPYPDADKLVFVTMGRPSDESGRRPLAGPEFAELAARTTLYTAMGAVFPTAGTLVEDGRPQPLRLAMVTTGFLPVFGVQPVRGRWFTPEAEGRNAEASLIISGALWQSRFGGAEVIGKRVRLDGGWGYGGGVYTIVGVMPSDFQMLMPLDASVPRTVDAWISVGDDLWSAPRNTFYLRAVGRVAPAATVSAAQEELERVGTAMMKRYTNYLPGRKFFAVPLKEDVIRRARTPLLMLQGAVILVLLIACGNVANLLVVRARTRVREIGVRLALGVPGHRLVLLMLTECLALALAGGILGMALAYGALRLLPLLAPDTMVRVDEAALNRPVLALSLVAAVGVGLLFAIVSILQARGADTIALLKTGTQGSRGSGRRRWRNTIVVGELALSVVLLVGAGLLIQTFLNLQRVDPGYRSAQVTTFRLSLPPERFNDVAAVARFSRTLEQSLANVAGVEAVGAVNQLPLDDVPNWSSLYRTRTPPRTQEPFLADGRLVTPGYFHALQGTLVKGRWLTEQDDERAAPVMLVDEKLARKAWPGQEPLDQELSVQVWTSEGFRPRWSRVVGVVRHLRHHDPSAEVREQFFVPFAQAPRNQLGVVVRSAIDPAALMRDVGLAIARIDAQLVPSQIQSLDTAIRTKQAPVRFSVTLAVLFASFSVVLACLGVYAVLSFLVVQRRSELAVRAALGATRRDLLQLVLGHGALLTGVGLALGVIGAAATTRWMSSVLFGVTTSDLTTFVLATIFLGATALMACYLPARRAGAVDPARILRTE